MSTPVELDIPHSLGKAAARARLDGGIGQIASRIPGGAQVRHDWTGDTMNFTVVAMGQQIASELTVFDDRVHAVVNLPMFLLPFAGMMKAAIEKEAPKLLR